MQPAAAGARRSLALAAVALARVPAPHALRRDARVHTQIPRQPRWLLC